MKYPKHLPYLVAALLLIGVLSCGRGNSVSSALEEYRVTTQFDPEEEVSAEEMDKLVSAATLAPVTRNITPWKFYILGPSKISILEQLKTVRPALCGAKNAIVICGLSGRMGESEMREFWAQDCAAAAENILLEARSMGLGANWLRVYPVQVRVDEVSAVMHLQPGEVPFAIIPVGKTLEADENPHPETPETAIVRL